MSVLIDLVASVGGKYAEKSQVDPIQRETGVQMVLRNGWLLR
jgi:hypothetical protein